MKIAFYNTHQFEKKCFEASNLKFEHKIHYIEPRLTEDTAALALGFDCVCAFVNDRLNKKTLQKLADGGTKIIALRCAGYNHVDLATAQQLGIKIVRVPEYSPHAVAEHTLALIMSLNRKIHRAYNRVKEHNFSLEGLTGFDLNNKTVGVIGTGRIGATIAKILLGFGCRVLAYDLNPNPTLQKMGVKYVDRDQLLRTSDIITLHVPLNPHTKYLLNDQTLAITKPGVMIINTSRGALIQTSALIQLLKSGHIGYAGLDVYEEEEGIFFEDCSDHVLQDDVLARLLTFSNVLITSHQAFLTHEALSNIADTTLTNISAFEAKADLINEVCSLP
jgi:D-lactate dehydrogenase